MGWWDTIKVAIGYERKSHTYDSSRIPDGDIKMISKSEMIKNEDGKISVCKKDSRGNWKCKELNVKPR
jgi:hypothetical protein